MPAKSKSQQHFFAMVRAYQKGELDAKSLPKDLVSKIKSAAKDMSKKEVLLFAKTKTEKLPTHIKESAINVSDMVEYIEQTFDVIEKNGIPSKSQLKLWIKDAYPLFTSSKIRTLSEYILNKSKDSKSPSAEDIDFWVRETLLDKIEESLTFKNFLIQQYEKQSTIK